MKKLCGLLLTGLILLCACQKEVSFENGQGVSSEGTLQSDLTGDCLPKVVAGTFEEGVILVSTANTIEVQVNVLKTGPYLVYTDTVNGYYFRSNGSFSATGLTTVTLQGTGKPLVTGIDNFTVRYGISECIVPVTVLPAGGGVPAEFTFNGGPGTCLNYDVVGDYVMGVALTSANTVAINVNVTTAGTYNVSTVASNGMTFSGTGTILEGAATLTLTGSGTPVNVGATDIPITAGSSTCSFAIDVLNTTPTAKNYFPHTQGSNWSYEADYDLAQPNDPGDTLLYRSNGLAPFNGNSYNIFEITDNAASGFGQDAAYRKDGNNYYLYTDLKYWSGLNDPQFVEFNFLKDDQLVGSVWTTQTFTGTADVNGVPQSMIFRMKFTILQQDVPITYNLTTGPVTYQNVIVVEERYEEQVNNVWQAYASFAKHHYARDIGLILDEYYDGNGVAVYRQSMRRYQIAP